MVYTSNHIYLIMLGTQTALYFNLEITVWEWG